MRNNKISLRQHPVAVGPLTMTAAPAVNLLCLLLLLFAVSPFILHPTAAQVYLPKTITSDTIPEQTATIAISGEDIIYFQNVIVTEKELKRILQSPSYKKQPILIKADRRSSLSRVIDVWNVCREIGLERVHLATTKNK